MGPGCPPFFECPISSGIHCAPETGSVAGCISGVSKSDVPMQSVASHRQIAGRFRHISEPRVWEIATRLKEAQALSGRPPPVSKIPARNDVHAWCCTIARICACGEHTPRTHTLLPIQCLQRAHVEDNFPSSRNIPKKWVSGVIAPYFAWAEFDQQFLDRQSPPLSFFVQGRAEQEPRKTPRVEGVRPTPPHPHLQVFPTSLEGSGGEGDGRGMC